ncbi:MAG: NAD(P)/FAD-dependent oxidoreductase [Desulfovibrionaceae bacterium]
MKDITIIGGGAAGILCALRIREKYPDAVVRIIEERSHLGHKITISGGGRCNISNENISPQNYSDPHFVRFALKAWTTENTKNLIESMSLPYCVRSHGRIFLDISAKKFVDILIKRVHDASISVVLNSPVRSFSKIEDSFICTTAGGIQYKSTDIIVATGSPAWRKTHSLSGIIYSLEVLGHSVYPFVSALAPLYMEDMVHISSLSGISLTVKIQCGQHIFFDNLLFTHNGISGPAVLQISSYWNGLDPIYINFLPHNSEEVFFTNVGKKYLKGLILSFLPERLAYALIPKRLMEKKAAELSREERMSIVSLLFRYECRPSSIAPLVRAEVAHGGLSLKEVNSKTMQSRLCPSLFIIGEALNVVGHLGGYNIHFAFSSATLCAQSI